MDSVLLRLWKGYLRYLFLLGCCMDSVLLRLWKGHLGHLFLLGCCMDSVLLCLWKGHLGHLFLLGCCMDSVLLCVWKGHLQHLLLLGCCTFEIALGTLSDTTKFLRTPVFLCAVGIQTLLPWNFFFALLPLSFPLGLVLGISANSLIHK